jgi:prepilin-type N-terminal cleavage/methylation domain-containing protein
MSDEHGFTLIEMLAAMLIVGILAAVAIPSFLSQQSKADGSSAEILAQTAETAAKTYAAEHGGSYTWGNNKHGLEALHEIEPGINTSDSAAAELAKAKEVSHGAGYELAVTDARTGDTYTIKLTAKGTLEHLCKSPKLHDCSKGKTGKW